MTEPTTAEGRALLRDRSYHAAGLITCPRWSNVGDEDAPCECDLPYAITSIEAAAAEAERARIVPAFRRLVEAFAAPISLPGTDGNLDDALAAARRVLAAIDDEAKPDRADPFTEGVKWADTHPAAVDDEAKTPEWRDDSGHWIGGNVGMPEPAIDDEAREPPALRIIRLTLWATREVGPRLLTTPADQEAAFRVIAPLVLAAIDDEAKG